MRKYNDNRWVLNAILTGALIATFLFILAGCNVEKRIAQAKVDAVALDHAQNPCANDTTIVTQQGETLVLIDTVRTTTTDTLTQTDTLKTTITITKHRTDTVMAVVVDKRLVNDYKDSVSTYKLKLAHLSGVNTELRQTLAEANKRAAKLLYVLFGIGLVIVAYVFAKIRFKLPI
jgi:hypothetical protein